MHDVEQSDLDLAGEVGEFVDGKNTAIGARQQAVVNGQFIGEVASATRSPDRVNVANNVRDGNVGSGEFFHVALVSWKPGDGRVVAFSGQAFAASAADGPQRVVINLASGDHWNFRVQKLHQATQDATFGLPAQSKQDEIVARQQGVHDLRDDAVVISMHAGKQRLIPFNAAQQIAANFVFYGQGRGARIEIRNPFPLAKRAWLGLSGVMKGSARCHGASIREPSEKARRALV